MSSSPVPPSRFAWPHFVLASVVVFAGFQVAAWQLVGVAGMDAQWWVTSSAFSLLGGLVVALASGRPTQVIVREIVHVAAAPARPTPPEEPSVVVDTASLGEAAPASEPAPSSLSAPVEPALVEDVRVERAAPEAVTRSSEPAALREVDASAVVQAAFAAAPAAGLPTRSPIATPMPKPQQAQTAPATSAPEPMPSADRNVAAEPAAALAAEWADALSQVAAPLLPVAERWDAAGPSADTMQAARALVIRLAVLRELLVPRDDAGATSGTSLRRFVESIVTHVADHPAAERPIRGLVRDDLADFWAFDARRLRRTLELLASELVGNDPETELHLLVTQVRMGHASALQFEFREDRPDGRRSSVLDPEGLLVRVVSWLVASLDGRLELPVQARGDQRVLVRIPAERIAEEESAFPAVEQSGAHVVVAPRPHTPTPAAAVNVVQSISRVLVVDDDAMARWSLTGQLAIHGYVADTAPSGEAALQILRERRYRAVLLDLYMPDANGFEVAAKIRSLEGDAGRVPIVGLTLRATADEQRRCREVGIDDCVVKPVQGEELAEVLQGLPALHQPAFEAAQAEVPADASDDEPPTLDTATLDRLAAIGRASGEADLGDRLVRMFDQKAPHAIAGIRAALGQQELQDAAQIARRLAESSSVIGARRMEMLARAALKAAEERNTPALAESVEALEQAYHRVKAVLRARVGPTDAR